MHGRSRTTIDPRIHARPERSTSGYHRSRRYCLRHARSAARCGYQRNASRLSCTLLRTLVRRNFLDMDDSVDFFFWGGEGVSSVRCIALIRYSLNCLIRRYRRPQDVAHGERARGWGWVWAVHTYGDTAAPRKSRRQSSREEHASTVAALRQPPTG